MAIATAVCTSFLQEMLDEQHDLASDTIKIALFTSAATLGAATTAYAATNESSGTNYTAGGLTLTNVAVSADGTTVIIDFDDPLWNNVTIPDIRGCLIYNATNGNKAIAVFDFAGTQMVSGGIFKLTVPAPAAATGIIRFG